MIQERTGGGDHTQFVKEPFAVQSHVICLNGYGQFKQISPDILRNRVYLQRHLHEIERNLERVREMVKRGLHEHAQLLRLGKHSRALFAHVARAAAYLNLLSKKLQLARHEICPALAWDLDYAKGRVVASDQVVDRVDTLASACPEIHELVHQLHSLKRTAD
jgi:hypothetical protein